jgi:hypothetical protein
MVSSRLLYSRNEQLSTRSLLLFGLAGETYYRDRRWRDQLEIDAGEINCR